MSARKRRPAARALGVLALTLAALGGCSEGGAEPYRHVVLITLDTLRADHVGCYGSTDGSTGGLTPRLDALAADGVRFADVTTAAPTTLAAHVSIMTGTYPHTHAAARNAFEVAQENALLAEVLRAAGFHTAAFLGSWALDRRFGFDQGFEYYDDRFEIAAGTDYEQDQRRAEQVTDAVLAHVDQTRAERRFLFVHYFDAHAPYDAPAAGAGPADGAPRGSTLADVKRAVHAHQARFLPDPPGFDRTIEHGIPAAVLAGADGRALPEDETLKADYAREVAYLDVHVGRLLDGLRARGLLEQALVVVVADHGESFHEHADFWNHGLWVYDTTARVPCIVWRSPALRAGDEAGRVVATPVSTVDLAPTVLALLGLAPPPGVEGTSLVPALRGEPFERGPVFCEATQPIDPVFEAGGWANRAKPRCVRSGPWKLVQAPLSGRTELFDLAADPLERADLAGDARQAAWIAELGRELGRWSRSAAPKASRGFNPEQSEEVRARLRALGYLGEDPEPPPEEPEDKEENGAGREPR